MPYDPQLIHYDTVLSGISVGYDNPQRFIANRLFPSLPVDKQSDRYNIFNRETWGRVRDDIRGPRGRANELPPMALSRDSFFAEEHSLVDLVGIEEQQQADAGITPLRDATERVTNSILLGREQSMTDVVTAVANYAAGFTVTLSGTAQWNDFANSDPIGNMKTGFDAIYNSLFTGPNTVIMGWQVARKLEDHTKVIDRIKYGAPGGGITGTDDILATLFGVSNFVRAGGGKLTSAESAATETVGYIWGKDVVLAYVPERPGKRTPAFGYEFTWAFENGAVMPTERWFDIDHKSDRVRVSRRYDLKLITVDGTGKSNGAGYLIKNAIA